MKFVLDASVAMKTVLVEQDSDKARNLYLVPAVGSVEVNGVFANARDGVAISDEARLTITALEDSELVLVDAA